jgi:hypothetical protein
MKGKLQCSNACGGEMPHCAVGSACSRFRNLMEFSMTPRDEPIINALAMDLKICERLGFCSNHV